MRTSTLSKTYICTLAICLSLLCSVDAGRRHRGRSVGTQPQYTYAVFDGIAQTHVVVTQGQPPPPPLPSRKHPGPVVQETCEQISCFTHEDCTYNGCGGYYCFHCETCETGRILGTCLWDRDSSAKNCPPVHCEEKSEKTSQSSATTAETTESQTEEAPTEPEETKTVQEAEVFLTKQQKQEGTSGDGAVENKPIAGGRTHPHKKWNPWEESFSELRLARLNKTEWAEPRDKKKPHGLTHYPTSADEEQP